ncbi:DUF3108 domain-containing protein [Methyloceanibacter caenitepidi]|nr:DUF3108 domain-containing protein [Methyloceanibacter caenitepidi]
MRTGPLRYWTGLLGMVFVCLAGTSAAFAEAALTDKEIKASYRVGVASIDLGTFNLTANVGRKDYTLKAKGEFSILAGLLYRANGKARSNGTLLDARPAPQRFDFSYADSNKTQALQIDFNGTARPAVTRTPKKRRDKKAVPLSDAQLRNVLDPLTAAFLSVQARVPAGDLAVCNQTLRVFDGKQLFELTLSPKRTEELGPKAAGGIPAAAVCAVRYQPIGGHRPESSAVTFLEKTEGIEAWLVPVQGTEMVVPYKVVVPTSWGDGMVKLTALKTEPAARRANAR